MPQSPCPYCGAILPHPAQQDAGEYFRCNACNGKFQFTGSAFIVGVQPAPKPNPPNNWGTNPWKELQKPEKVSVLDGFRIGMGCWLFSIALFISGALVTGGVLYLLWKILFAPPSFPPIQ